MSKEDIYREALERIAGNDPDGLEGFHFTDDDKKPHECPGCIARAALGPILDEDGVAA